MALSVSSKFCDESILTFQLANGRRAPRKNTPVRGPKAAPTNDIEICARFPPTSKTKNDTAVHTTPSATTVEEQ